ncbi:von Willebrand factor A domain-containing protein 5B1 [Latimeria chalumnae]|uniref:von Willebrand factor A domain-containing protein 5B1 n=1 Tax=Latimeria chalumnae TaxID=7897 RepID=UPI0006D9123E|nr:PREDICTED: von Willebrand factor A domain-containing protein 5B1 [Latimeria chalumnae]|eukprot:XP_014353627.1 PREDICTED: von Willebrand factor A domain-containing protein 5B1 [Latimeria chalumnae]
MPGLINRSKNSHLPLTASEVTSCVSGYTLGMTSSLTYSNLEAHPIEGLFVYPLDEYTTVVGFEAMISGRIITVQIKDKAKIDDCHFDCCSLSDGGPQNGNGAKLTSNIWFLPAGRILLDEDLERIVFVVNLGVIPPLETVTVLISTSSELQVLQNGAVRVILPSICVPRVLTSCSDDINSAENQLRNKDRHHCGLGPQDQSTSTNQFCLSRLLEHEATNPMEYDFNFHLEIRGPCLLAGVESPTHSIRADADPSARSATSIVITLADKHTFDRPVEIVIHPSEPHRPHILMEDGDMTPDDYEAHLQRRSDFIKGTKKDPSSEKKTEIIRKRLNKDMTHNPIIMLNFCPNLRDGHPNLKKAQGEFIFLMDRSGSMSGINISRVKDAMIVILKSLAPACLFNIIGFGSTFRTLFPSSQTYNEDTLAVACDYIRKIRADMGGTNLLSPLTWILRQPVHRGHPRLLFLLTDGAVSNTGKVIELVRNHARSARCYSFGIGHNACRRLVNGLATVSKGTAEFLVEGERLQPKMVKSLKKAMAPVLTDITIDWFFPETTEVLLSPVGTSFLFPEDRLIGYSIVCDTSRYHPNPKSDKRRRYSMMCSQESTSSVFYHSQDEACRSYSESRRTSKDVNVGSLRDSCQELTPEFLSISEEQERDSERDSGTDMKSSPRRRAYSTNQIADQSLFRRNLTTSDPAAASEKNPLRRAKFQELGAPSSPEALTAWESSFQQPFLINPPAPTLTSRNRGVSGRRPSLLHQNCLSFSQDVDLPQVQANLNHVIPGRQGGRGERSFASKSSTESQSLGSSGDLGHYKDPDQVSELTNFIQAKSELFQHSSLTFEFDTSLEAVSHDLNVPHKTASYQPRSDCKAVINGLLCGEPVQWEVAFDIASLFQGKERQLNELEDVWNETFHHLAVRSIIRDFEQMAEKENEIEHGSGRKHQLSAIQTSKACNVISKYTAFVPVDLGSNEFLPTIIEYCNTAAVQKQSSPRGWGSGSRKFRGYSIGLGRSQSSCTSDGVEDGFYITNLEDNNLSPCSTPSSSGWEKCSFAEAPQRSPSISSVHSQRSVETLFAARLTLSKARLLTKAARGFMCKSPTKMSEPTGETEHEYTDYLPLVSLQLASGAFLLNQAFCEAINIPLEKIKWTSPFTSHRTGVSPTTHSSSSSIFSNKTSVKAELRSPGSSQECLSSGLVHQELNGESDPPPEEEKTGKFDRKSRSGYFLGSQLQSQPETPKTENELLLPPPTVRRYSSPDSSRTSTGSHSDSGRGSEADSTDAPAFLFSAELQQSMEPEGMLWATAVALAWLEHRSARYFIEWELVAAKASMWLSFQQIPEGRNLSNVKAAARQLFVLLRHWDENLQLNMLCYNPNSV